MHEETLVPLDLSDALAMIDRQRQQIVLLQEAQDKILRLCEDCGEEGIACFKEKDDQIATLKALLGEKEIRISELERDYETVRNLLIETRDQIAALKAFVHSLTEDVETRDDRIEKLIVERDRLWEALEIIASGSLINPTQHAEEALQGEEV